MAKGQPMLTARDFSILDIPGFAERMSALRENLSPKLEAVGQALLGDLLDLTGAQFHVHVARHMRRRVNPPDDTWVALSESRRGYKMLPHFEVGLFRDHLFLRVGVIYEAEDRHGFARALSESLADLPDHLEVVFDHQRPGGVPIAQLRRDPSPIQANVGKRLGEVLLEWPVPVAAVVGQDLLSLIRPELGAFARVYRSWRALSPEAVGALV